MIGLNFMAINALAEMKRQETNNNNWVLIYFNAKKGMNAFL